MKNNLNPTLPASITCPACGMLCDDLVLTSSAPVSIQNACAKSITFFEQSFHSASKSTAPSVSGKTTDLDTAIKAAAAILAQSKAPLIAGLGTEVQGMRAIMRLAATSNATLDHMHSESSVRNTLTMQNGGWLTTTLSEVKNRADLILAIGTDIGSSHPRFFEKLVWDSSSMFDKPNPEVIYLGVPADKAQAATSPAGKVASTVGDDPKQVPEIVNALNALLINKKINAETVGGVAVATLQALVEKLKAAKYAVVVWSASSLKFSHAELTIQSIVQLVNQLNETTRAAGLPLNSGDGDSSVNNTSTWLSGYPTRNRFVNGKPEYDNYHFSTQKQLQNSDALLWVSSFNPTGAPQTALPTIVIGHPGTKFERTPDVFIPVGIPGVDHAGAMFRMDSSITLPLKKLRNNELPNLSEVITKIEAELA